MHVSIRQISYNTTTYAAIYITGYSLWGSSFIRTHEFLCRVVFKVKKTCIHIYIYSLKHKSYVNTVLHISFSCFLQKNWSWFLSLLFKIRTKKDNKWKGWISYGRISFKVKSTCSLGKSLVIGSEHGAAIFIAIFLDKLIEW